ncbi:MAG: ketopantoate reductase family protein [Chloroflexota bacterium]|nr:ketopantoate reductase family protein [Chloroflexota bacterium]
MKVVIMGAGALGALFGAVLADGGEDVTLVEIRDEVVDLIGREGIKVTMPNGEVKNSRVGITKNIQEAGIADLVIVAVKSFATENAVKGAMPAIGDTTYVMSVQNGAGNIEIVAQVLGDETRSIGGVFLSSVTPVKPNEFIYVYGAGGLRIGPLSGVLTPMLDKIVESFRQSGMEIEIAENVQDLVWNKVLMNVVNCLAATLEVTNNEFLEYPSNIPLIRGIVTEAAEVAKAKGIHLSNPDDPVAPLMGALESFRAAGQKGKASMLQDIERKSRTEIDALNGTIVAEGKKYGIATPYNEVFTYIIKSKEERILAKGG